MFLGPMQVTLPTTTVCPGTVVSMFPPASAARSTVTLPGGITSIMDFLIIRGAFLPGINAVVMITLVVAHSFNNILSAASCHSLDISLA